MHIPTAVHDRHWGLMSYPPGMCIGTKPNAAETEPSATSTEEPIGGFLISLKSLGIWGPWILKWITSADNPGGQCNSGKALPTCMLLLSSHKSFYVSNNVTTPFGGHHCPWAQSRYMGPSLYCLQDELTRKKCDTPKAVSITLWLAIFFFILFGTNTSWGGAYW